MPAVLEAVTQHLGAPQLCFGPHEQRPARRAGNQAEGGRVPAARHARQQLLEPGGVGIDAGLDVVCERGGRSVRGRPACQPDQLATGAPDECLHQLHEKPAARVHRVAARMRAEPAQVPIEAGVAPALDDPPDDVRRPVVERQGRPAHTRPQRARGRLRQVRLGEQVGERGAEIEQTPHLLATLNHRRGAPAVCVLHRRKYGTVESRRCEVSRGARQDEGTARVGAGERPDRCRPDRRVEREREGLVRHRGTTVGLAHHDGRHLPRQRSRGPLELIRRSDQHPPIELGRARDPAHRDPLDGERSGDAESATVVGDEQVNHATAPPGPRNPPTSRSDGRSARR
jgi:hypothetical protein